VTNSRRCGTAILPQELLRLPAELQRVDALLDEERFFTPFRAYFDLTFGRPSIPVETYLRLILLKVRYRLEPSATATAPTSTHNHAARRRCTSLLPDHFADLLSEAVYGDVCGPGGVGHRGWCGPVRGGGGGSVARSGGSSGQTSRTRQGAWSSTNRVAWPRLRGPRRVWSPSRASTSSPARAPVTASTASVSMTCSSTICSAARSRAASTHACQVPSVTQTMIIITDLSSRRPQHSQTQPQRRHPDQQARRDGQRAQPQEFPGGGGMVTGVQDLPPQQGGQ
jgi:hypothetical protein